MTGREAIAELRAALRAQSDFLRRELRELNERLDRLELGLHRSIYRPDLDLGWDDEQNAVSSRPGGPQSAAGD